MMNIGSELKSLSLQPGKFFKPKFQPPQKRFGTYLIWDALSKALRSWMPKKEYEGHHLADSEATNSMQILRIPLGTLEG